MYYVYIIVNEEGKTYIGYTSDLENRLEAHNSGKNSSTKNHKWKYVYYEAFKSQEDARERERRLKNHGQSKRQLKARIIRSIQATVENI